MTNWTFRNVYNPTVYTQLSITHQSHFDVLNKKAYLCKKIKTDIDMSDSSLLSQLLSVLIPESLSSFELVGVKEYPDRIELRIEESVDNVEKLFKCCVKWFL
jgi:hypothetical protein